MAVAFESLQPANQSRVLCDIVRRFLAPRLCVSEPLVFEHLLSVLPYDYAARRYPSRVLWLTKAVKIDNKLISAIQMRNSFLSLQECSTRNQIVKCSGKQTSHSFQAFPDPLFTLEKRQSNIFSVLGTKNCSGSHRDVFLFQQIQCKLIRIKLPPLSL